jgi:hypothetical protein
MSKKKPEKKKAVSRRIPVKRGIPAESPDDLTLCISNNEPDTLPDAQTGGETLYKDNNLENLEKFLRRAREVKELMSGVDVSSRDSGDGVESRLVDDSKLVDEGLYGLRTYPYSNSASDFYYGIGPVPDAKTHLGIALERTATLNASVVASRRGVETTVKIPSFQRVLNESLKVLKDSSLPGSSRFAAKVLLEYLITLSERLAQNGSDLIGAQLAFYCGSLWEQLQQVDAQQLAATGKKVSKGRRESEKVRDKSLRRIAAFRQEKLRCKATGETFIIGDACTKIATEEVEADEKLEGLKIDERRTRIKSRAKQIYKQLHKKYPEEVGKQ